MYDQLRARLAELLSRPRLLKPQTDRQLGQYLSEHSSSLGDFLLCAAEVLEEYQLDMLFGPVFTPSLDERAEAADLLFHWRPSAEQLKQLVADLCVLLPYATVLLPDGAQARLTTHEVMFDRYVRLLRLDGGPSPEVAAALRDSVPAELWKVGIALLCERGMTPAHQRWFAGFINHMAGRRVITRGLLESTVEFVASQSGLGQVGMLAAAESLLRATQGTASYAASGHSYWSPDVAQHHHYRGEGRIDKGVLEQRQAEVGWVTALVEDLRTYDDGIASG